MMTSLLLKQKNGMTVRLLSKRKDAKCTSKHMLYRGEILLVKQSIVNFTKT